MDLRKKELRYMQIDIVVCRNVNFALFYGIESFSHSFIICVVISLATFNELKDNKKVASDLTKLDREQ